MANAISWFQIPCADFARGKRFYETILNTTLQDISVPGMQMAGFPIGLSGYALEYFL
jgi:predicted enzyme related to lactoylglutathione lyase